VGFFLRGRQHHQLASDGRTLGNFDAGVRRSYWSWWLLDLSIRPQTACNIFCRCESPTVGSASPACFGPPYARQCRCWRPTIWPKRAGDRLISCATSGDVNTAVNAFLPPFVRTSPRLEGIWLRCAERFHHSTAVADSPIPALGGPVPLAVTLILVRVTAFASV
jgi:hypothetical protein